MSSTSGTPRATISRSTRRGRRILQFLPRHQTPRFAGAFFVDRVPVYPRAPDTVDRSAAVRSSASGREHAMKNLLTDIAGVRVGHADDAKLASGVTAVINALRDRDAHELQRSPSTELCLQAADIAAFRTKRRRRGTPTPPSLYRAVAEPVSPVLHLGWRYTPRRATGSRP